MQIAESLAHPSHLPEGSKLKQLYSNENKTIDFKTSTADKDGMGGQILASAMISVVQQI